MATRLPASQRTREEMLWGERQGMPPLALQMTTDGALYAKTERLEQVSHRP
jgi:hypothetical protein